MGRRTVGRKPVTVMDRVQKTTLVIAAILSTAFCAPRARAYTRTVGPKPDTSVAWRAPKLSLRLADELPRGLLREDAMKALERAARSWSAPAVRCTSVEIGVLPPDSAQPRGTNVVDVSFRLRYWCHHGVEHFGNCYDSHLAALTTLELSASADVSSPDAGQAVAPIVNAEIELNGIDFSWTADEGSRTQHPSADLERTVLHELGHVLGFTHNCSGGPLNSSVPRVDAVGVPVPTCDAGSPSLQESVMFPFDRSPAQAPTLNISADEAQGLCAVYPANAVGSPVPSLTPGGCGRTQLSSAGPSKHGRSGKSSCALTLDGARPWWAAVFGFVCWLKMLRGSRRSKNEVERGSPASRIRTSKGDFRDGA